MSIFVAMVNYGWEECTNSGKILLPEAAYKSSCRRLKLC